jgi:hypothetical protein
MYRRCAAVGLSLIGLLSLAPGQASASAFDARPLQLGLSSSFSPAARANAGREARGGTPRMPAAAGRKGSGPAEAEQNLRQRALLSILNAPDQPFAESRAAPGQAAPMFRFERQGSAVRDLARGYKGVLTKVSSKIWDEPNGRRIRFDIAGKPGIGVEFPIR